MGAVATPFEGEVSSLRVLVIMRLYKNLTSPFNRVYSLLVKARHRF
jgi:hypothetical protein